MKETEKQNIEYADRIDLKSELGEIILNYKGKSAELLIERRKRTKNVWQLVEVDTNNILWKGNEKAMLGGIAKFFLRGVEHQITEIIKDIDAGVNRVVQISVLRNKPKQ